MPIIRMPPYLIYYAHVPKCAGSSVEDYLFARFGRKNVALLNKRHHFVPADQRWSRTSPQHIDLDVAGQLFPGGFFDASFTVVRHPVARLVSAYHFQAEVEQCLPNQMSFSDWLLDLPKHLEADCFAFDNHIRPMVDLVPANAKVFHLEYGLDAIVPWFDELTGEKTGPRALSTSNERSSRNGKTTKVIPSADDLAVIAEAYAEDFARFNYTPEDKMPLMQATALSTEFMLKRDDELARRPGLGTRLRKRLTRSMR